MTRKKPTQSQFWTWIDSFFNLDEDNLPISKVTNLATTLNSLQLQINSFTGPGKIELDAGALSMLVTADMLIEVIVIKDGSNPIVSIGTTDGGTDIADSLQLSGGVFILDMKLLKTAGDTIYFTGVTVDTLITIYKR
ncbi:MAG TPA: hypothetical protein PKM63_21960 [Panacibacter sp.]|nr:hypothetical protein [Panacibacter sp.]HNP46979.1 hypothetical protein [Panacibacter sp.]